MKAELPQHAGKSNKRQADKGGGVIRTHAVHQSDTQAFGLGTARRIIGLLEPQIPGDFIVCERAEPAKRNDVVAVVAASVADTQGTVKFYCPPARSEEHTSELQSLMRISYAVFCLKKKRITRLRTTHYDVNYKITE